MTNREQYERMIYLNDTEVDIALAALSLACNEFGEPNDYNARELFLKIAKHYNVDPRGYYMGGIYDVSRT